jgi:dihydrofolate synthase/folylpolyglutamate synthase
MEIESILKKLFSLHTFGIKLGLDNISAFLQHIGNPQLDLKAFHIAGSNGKGSTSAFISSILQECGYKTGLYTSPHFVKFNERILVNNQQIPDANIAEFFEKHEDYIDEHQLTFFEVTTAMAFQYFKDQNVDYAVIETGLGGRLDATNVFNSIASVITSISLEHTQILGETIKEIAGEKAAIIKKNSNVFIGKLHYEAETVIAKKCNETNSRFFRIEDYFNNESNVLELQNGKIMLNDNIIPLRGDYQKYNAAIASLVIYETLNIDDFSMIKAGISGVISNTGFQGRYEYYNQRPDIIFDSAHNPEGVNNFIKEFRKDCEKYSKRMLIFGVLKDKNTKEMLNALNNNFDEIYVTEIRIERTLKTDELIKIANEAKITVQTLDDPSLFISDFRVRAGADECLVVLGSMYLLGEIKSKIPDNKFA